MKLFELTSHTGDPEKREAIEAMRRAAVTLFQGQTLGVERVKLEIQTIGLNKGLSVQEAAEYARRIVAEESRRRRELD
jgi:hypothetical protein